MAKYRREDLAARTVYFTSARFDMSRVPAGSLIVFYANDPNLPAFLGPGKCAIAARVTDVAGGASAVVLRKGS